MSTKIPKAEELLTEVDPDALTELFSSKPPFNRKTIKALVKNLRAKRKVWARSEATKARRKGRPAGKDPALQSITLNDLFGDKK